MPPPPRRAMVPDRNCRQLDCPVPIAHRGGAALLRLPWGLSFYIKKIRLFQSLPLKKPDDNPTTFNP